MRDPLLLTWRHCEADIILWAVWWYLRDVLKSHDVEERPWEHGVGVDHTTVSRGVERHALALEKRCRPSLGVIVIQTPPNSFAEKCWTRAIRRSRT